MRARPVRLVLVLVALVAGITAPAYAAKPPPPSATLAMPASAQVRSPLTAQVSVTPVESGRVVRLEQLSGSTWSVVASSTLPASGVVSLATTAPGTAASYSFRATLPATKKSAALTSATATVSVVLPPPPIVYDTALPVAVLGQPYSFTFTTTDGRAGTWRNAAAAGPWGLTLSTSGVLSGTPTADPNGTIADYTVRVDFTDVDGQTVFASRMLSVRTPSPVITSAATLPVATVGQYYETHLAKSTPYPGRWTLTGGTLPAGLRLDVDGTISNTPTEATTPGTAATIQVTVTDSHALAPGSDTKTFYLVVEPAP